MTEKNGSKTPTKAQAVLTALQELGRDAKRGPIGTFIKERFGIDMKPDHISTARGEALKKLAGNGKPKAKKTTPPAKQEAAPVAAPPPKRTPLASSNGTAVELDDILTLKGLVGRVGAANLRKLIDIVG